MNKPTLKNQDSAGFRPKGLLYMPFRLLKGMKTGEQSEGTVWYWDNPSTTAYASADYATWNSLGGTIGGGGNTPGSIIGTAQGFKVKASSTGSVQFTNAMRVAGNTNMLFRWAGTKRLWLSATSDENRVNQLLVGFAIDGSDGVDWAYDASKLNSQSDLSFYSLLDGKPYAIQGYGELEPQRIVPLGLVSGFNTTVTIALDDTDNMSDDDIILEDRYLNIFTDMHEGDYIFQSDAASYQDRFFLHFGPMSVTGISESDQGIFMSSYINNGILSIRLNTEVPGDLEILDMSGRSVWVGAQITLNESPTQIDVSDLSTGIYIVRLSSEKGTVSKKVMK